MPSLLPSDLYGGAYQGLVTAPLENQARKQQIMASEAEMLELKRKAAQEQEMIKARQQASGSLSPELQGLFPYDPQSALKIQEDQQQLQEKKDQTRSQGLMGLFNLPEDKRQEAYPSYFAQLGGAKSGLPQQYDPNTLMAMMQSGIKPADQIDARKPATDNRPSEVKEYEYYTQQENAAGRQPKSFNDWSLQAKKAGASNTIINTGTALGKEVAKNFADELSKIGTDANSAANTIPTIQNSIRLVDEGLIAGTGANWRLGAAKALATVTGTPDSDVNNTDEFIANTANLVAQNIKNFGAGTGLSDADREYAQKMAGGSITMSPQAIKRVLQINERMQRGKIKQYNDKRETLLKNNPELAGYYPEIVMPKELKETPQAGGFSDPEKERRYQEWKAKQK